jgi:hypothetical protein
LGAIPGNLEEMFKKRGFVFLIMSVSCGFILGNAYLAQHYFIFGALMKITETFLILLL